jgi:hypothetical protein
MLELKKLELKKRARDLDHKKCTEQCFGLEEQLRLGAGRRGVRRKLTTSCLLYLLMGRSNLKDGLLDGWSSCAEPVRLVFYEGATQSFFGLYLGAIDTRHKRRPGGKYLHIP